MDSKYIHEKMVNVISHQTNSNQNHMRSIQNGFFKKSQCQLLTRMWSSWNSRSLLVGMQNGTATLGNSLVNTQKVKHMTDRTQQFPRAMKTIFMEKPIMQKFTVVLLIIAKNWKQLKGLSINEWINKQWFIYSVEYSALKKE